ncbi:MAG: hypothetical protein L6265_08970 [Thermoplasmatales archaeon]|nr:hypothetical protein [Thermoplasmatales archaeon]
MLEVCKANLNRKVVIVYSEGNETKGTTGKIRDANESFVLLETDSHRKIWVKPSTIIKVKEVV